MDGTGTSDACVITCSLWTEAQIGQVLRMYGLKPVPFKGKARPFKTETCTFKARLKWKASGDDLALLQLINGELGALAEGFAFCG